MHNTNILEYNTYQLFHLVIQFRELMKQKFCSKGPLLVIYLKGKTHRKLHCIVSIVL